VEDHLKKFLKILEYLEMEHEDVIMNIFMQTLEGEAWILYKSLVAGSIRFGRGSGRHLWTSGEKGWTTIFSIGRVDKHTKDIK